MYARLILLTLLVAVTATATAGAGVVRTIYQINAGGQYTYLPSPEGPGIPGGDPGAYQLDFELGGWFTYELDLAGPTAQLRDLNLTLSGNEAIQALPPALTPVTADRVEDYLAGHTFVEDFIGGLLHLESSSIPGLKLTDGLNGDLTIHGGFDATPADGVGILFNFSAIALPHLPGDTNADGVVDLSDLNNVRNNFGGAGVGDTNGDGVVDLADVNNVRNFFGASAAAPAPEPGSMALLIASAFGAALGLRWRQRSRAG